MKKRYIFLGMVFGLIGLVILLVLIGSLVVQCNDPDAASFANSKEAAIGIIEISGVIMEPKPVMSQIRHFGQLDRIKAIILRIDSPGGGVAAAQEIYDEIRKVRAKKKVIASMSNMAASGGYYVACAADKIVANAGTLTGSIGVIMEFKNLTELMNKIGVKNNVFKSGLYKDIGSPTKDITPDEKKLMQEVINNVHEQFVTAISEGRNLTKEAVRKIADGRILSGQQAKALDLVDVLGNFYAAVDLAKEMAGLSGDPELVYEKKKKTFWENLLPEEVFQHQFKNLFREVIEEEAAVQSYQLKSIVE